MLHVMGKIKFLRLNLSLKQHGFMRAHAYASLCISLVTACIFSPLPKNCAADHLCPPKPQGLSCPLCLRTFQSCLWSGPNTAQFRAYLKLSGAKIFPAKSQNEDTDWWQCKQWNNSVQTCPHQSRVNWVLIMEFPKLILFPLPWLFLYITTSSAR